MKRQMETVRLCGSRRGAQKKKRKEKKPSQYWSIYTEKVSIECFHICGIDMYPSLDIFDSTMF